MSNDDLNLQFASKVHDLSSESLELEDALIDSLAALRMLNAEDPNPALDAGIEVNMRMLKCLMSQRTLNMTLYEAMQAVEEMIKEYLPKR